MKKKPRQKPSSGPGLWLPITVVGIAVFIASAAFSLDFQIVKARRQVAALEQRNATLEQQAVEWERVDRTIKSAYEKLYTGRTKHVVIDVLDTSDFNLAVTFSHDKKITQPDLLPDAELVRTKAKRLEATRNE